MANYPKHDSRKRNSTGLTQSQTTGLIVGGVAVLIAIFGCAMISYVSISRFFRSVNNTPDPGSPAPSVASWAADSAELTVAVSPLMAPVLQSLAETFNQQSQNTPDGKTMQVTVIALEPQKMIEQAVARPAFQALSPDSSLWLDRLEQSWAERNKDQASTQASGAEIPIGQSRSSESTRYAISPIVIAMWEDLARSLGWPDKQLTWQDLQNKAAQDDNFKWSHPSTGTATGLLATLAEFYAGSGLTRGLTTEAATAQKTVDYVRAIEGTVRFYGEGEEVVVQRLLSEGRGYLDAFVAQERVVVDWNENKSSNEKLVAIYPAEGTFWTDHPLALLQLNAESDGATVTDNQRLTYRAFAQFLGAADAQEQLLQNGYRPADLSIALDRTGSPFANNKAVDWRQPQTTLQMPPSSVIDVVLNFWYYTKRPTNVYLVIDTSGSMEGEKLERAKAAIQSFIGQIQGDRDKIALVEFGSGVKHFTSLTVMNDSSRTQMQSQVQNMVADGGTALIDAVYQAANDLAQKQDREAINALVVMTDGRENESYYGLSDLKSQLGNIDPKPVIFTIAFGSDADDDILSEIARIGGGQFRRATEMDIQELYKAISTYF